VNIGIDWCQSGWLAVILEEGGYRLELYPTAYSIWYDIGENAELEEATVFIDVPIGLTEDGGRRECDTEAREKTAKPSSVFPPPTRDAAYEDTYPKAKSRNEKITDGERSLGTQTWGIVPRIREVDEVLRNHEEARDVFYESHPEVCFWALNGGEPIGHSKDDETGKRKREGILRGFESYPVEGIIDDFEKEYESRGSMVSVGRDDLYDAVALALCASADEYEALPGEKTDVKDVPMDNEGLPMRMVYARSESVLSV
jgi:predicted RNase H-like nuclease